MADQRRCKWHAGSTPTHAKSAQLIAASEAIRKLGIVADGRIDPRDALALELWQMHCRKQAIEMLIADLELSRGQDGLFAPTFHATGRSTGEHELHPLLQLRLEVFKRIEALGSACHRAGVEERRIQLEADRTEAMARLIRAVLGHESLALTPEQQNIGLRFAAQQLRALSAGESDPRAA